MKAILSEDGFAFNATEYIGIYGNERLLRLQRSFTIRTVDRTTKIPQVTKLFRMIRGGGTCIIELPRFAINKLFTSIPPSATAPITSVECQLPTHDRLDHMNYIGKSNPNQQIVVQHVVEELFAKCNHVAGTTLKVSAGVGKTYIAMDIMGKMKLKTLIVVPNTYLLDQWVGVLREYFPHVRIGMLYGKRKVDGDIIVGIINTVSDLQEFQSIDKKPVPNVGKALKHLNVKTLVSVDAILKNVGLTIFDESHMYVSKEFRKVFRRISSRFTIGLSATPDQREDKLDVIHESWLGPILDAETLDGYKASRDSFESDAKLIEYHAKNENCKFNVREDGIIDYSSIVESIVNDPHRNQIIVDEIMSLMTKGHYTFVFSDRRSHLEHLYDLLEEQCKVPVVMEIPESSRKIILYGGSSKETIDKAKQLSSVIFTTYAYSSTGVSIIAMNALVLATPRRSNMKQIINRVFRLGSDRSIRRQIVDLVDTKLPLKRQVRERVKAYVERGSSISKSIAKAA